MKSININGRIIGPGQPTYIVAEMSGNHNQDYKRAVRIIEAAKQAGADAVKLQTYTPNTITADCDSEYFRLQGTLWDGRRLYDLYGEACTPWEWHQGLKDVAEGLGLDFFSSPFDATAVDFLEQLNVPVYKVASSELVDIPLLRKIAQCRKPVILSTGMATLGEIEEAMSALRQFSGEAQVALLKCSSTYPAQAEDMNLLTIPNLSDVFSVPVGLSDHTMGIEVSLAAVALGACIIEKHLTLSRSEGGPDAAFSLEPEEFHGMVKAVRVVGKALGGVKYGFSERERISRRYRRSLFVVEDVRAGEAFTLKNIRSIRPGDGLHPRYLDEVMGRTARCDLGKGTPLSWEIIELPRADTAKG